MLWEGCAIKLAAAVKGTEHAYFNARYVWDRLRSLFPEDINPTSVSQQEAICNEWTTFSKVNDGFDFNKITILESGLAK